MKVRIGIGIGRSTFESDAFGELLDAMTELGFDSLWLSEVLTGGGFDPLVGLAYAAARQPELKLGTTMLLPGRNVIRLAKQLSSLDRLSQGRLLVTFVPGLDTPPEREAIASRQLHRGRAMDEAMPVLRELLAGQLVSHSGDVGCFENVMLSPLPVQQPLEFWMGGFAPAALTRCGALADGWLPSLCPPGQAESGRAVIEEAAAQAGRSISSEHFGVSVPYARVPLEQLNPKALPSRRSAELVPVSLQALRELLQRFMAVGFSKFVVRPLQPPASWSEELEALADAVGDLQN